MRRLPDLPAVAPGWDFLDELTGLDLG
jgi:hypothetical protein